MNVRDILSKGRTVKDNGGGTAVVGATQDTRNSEVVLEI
jgi:hypothetical protein